MEEGKKLKIGLALGGGGAKGIAHIGVLKVLEENGIEISVIGGTSAGSIIAGAYALGLNNAEIMKRCEKFGSSKFTRISNFRVFSDSLIKDRDINEALKSILGEKTTVSDLKIPFFATAVNLESGREVVMKEGKLWEIARASSAIPFVFSPVFLGGQYLVDGGLLNNVPVDHLREQANLDLIIGVEVGGMTSRQYISGIVWQKYYNKPKGFRLLNSVFKRIRTNITMMAAILLRSIDIMKEESQKMRYEKAKPDMILKVQMDDISILAFNRFEDAIKLGIDAARKALPQILRLIEEKKTSPKPETD